MKTRNSLSEKFAVFFALCLSFLFTYTTFAQKAPIQNTNEKAAVGFFPKCTPPDYILILPQSHYQLNLEWERIYNAQGYNVNLKINGRQIGNYYSPRHLMSITLNNPLQDKDKIEVCINTICENGLPSAVFCQLATSLTAIATVKPVYLQVIEDHCPDDTMECPLISFKDIMNDNGFGNNYPCPEFNSLMGEKMIYATEDVCNELSSLNVNTSNPAQNCDNLKEFLLSLGSNPEVDLFVFLGNTPDDCDVYGKTRTNRFTAIPAPIVLPNPVQDHCFMHYELLEKGAVTLSIFDALGRNVLEEQRQQEKGQQRLTVDIAHLPEGILYYTLTINDTQHQGKLIRMK